MYKPVSIRRTLYRSNALSAYIHIAIIYVSLFTFLLLAPLVCSEILQQGGNSLAKVIKIFERLDVEKKKSDRLQDLHSKKLLQSVVYMCVLV